MGNAWTAILWCGRTRFCPFADHSYGPDHRVLRSANECEGCGLEVCLQRGNECLNRIQTAEVLRAAHDLLHARLALSA